MTGGILWKPTKLQAHAPSRQSKTDPIPIQESCFYDLTIPRTGRHVQLDAADQRFSDRDA